MDRSVATLIILLGVGLGASGLFWGTHLGNAQKRKFVEERRKMETRHQLELDKIQNGDGGSGTSTKVAGELHDRVSWLEEQLTLYQDENARLLRSIDEMLAGGAKLPDADGGARGVEEGERKEFDEEETKILKSVEELTAGIRKLGFVKPATYTFATWDEIKDHIRAGLENKDDPGGAHQSRAYAAMGFVKPGTNVLAEMTSLAGAQLGTALYLGEGEIAFNREGSLHSVHDRTALSIQLVHVLREQHFAPADSTGADSDAGMASRALAVGDGELVKLRFMMQDDNPSRDELRASPTALSKDVLDAAPAFIREQFLFPYTMGTQYCRLLYDKDKWESVNAAFANPPATSSQILHPDGPVEPEEFAFPVATLTVRDTMPIWNDVAGELGISLLLNQANYLSEMAGAGIDAPGEMPLLSVQDFMEKPGSVAAAGWKGDRYLVYPNGDAADTTDHVVWITAWKDDKEAGEFLTAMESALRARYHVTSEDVPEGKPVFQLAENRHLTLEQLDGNRVLLVNAADAEWHAALRQTFAQP